MAEGDRLERPDRDRLKDLTREALKSLPESDPRDRAVFESNILPLMEVAAGSGTIRNVPPAALSYLLKGHPLKNLSVSNITQGGERPGDGRVGTEMLRKVTDRRQCESVAKVFGSATFDEGAKMVTLSACKVEVSPHVRCADPGDGAVAVASATATVTERVPPVGIKSFSQGLKTLAGLHAKRLGVSAHRSSFLTALARSKPSKAVACERARQNAITIRTGTMSPSGGPGRQSTATALSISSDGIMTSWGDVVDDVEPPQAPPEEVAHTPSEYLACANTRAGERLVECTYTSVLELKAVGEHENTLRRILDITHHGMYSICGDVMSSSGIMGLSGLTRDQCQSFRDKLRANLNITKDAPGEALEEFLSLERMLKSEMEKDRPAILGEIVCLPNGLTSPEGRPLVDACGCFSSPDILDVVTSVVRSYTPYSVRVDGTHDTTCNRLILVTVLVETVFKSRTVIFPWLCYYAATENSDHMNAALKWVCDLMLSREVQRRAAQPSAIHWRPQAPIPPPLFVMSDQGLAFPLGFKMRWPELASRIFFCESHINKSYSDSLHGEHAGVLEGLRQMNRALDLPTYLFQAHGALARVNAGKFEEVLRAIRDFPTNSTMARLDLGGLPGAFLSATANSNNDMEGAWHSLLKLRRAVGTDGSKLLSPSTPLCTSVTRVCESMTSELVRAITPAGASNYALSELAPPHWRPLLELFEDGLLRERQAFHMNKAIRCYRKGVVIAGKLLECARDTGDKYLVCMWTRHANCGVVCWCVLARDLYWFWDGVKFLNPPQAMPRGYEPTATFGQVPPLEPSDDDDEEEEEEKDKASRSSSDDEAAVEEEEAKTTNLKLLRSSSVLVLGAHVRAPARAPAAPEAALAGALSPLRPTFGCPELPRLSLRAPAAASLALAVAPVAVSADVWALLSSSSSSSSASSSLSQYAMTALAERSGGSLLTGSVELAAHGHAGRKSKKEKADAKRSSSAAAPRRGDRERLIELPCAPEDGDRFLTNELVTHLIVDRYCPAGAPMGPWPGKGKSIKLTDILQYRWLLPRELRFDPGVINKQVREWAAQGFANIDRTPIRTAEVGSWLTSRRTAADDDGGGSNSEPEDPKAIVERNRDMHNAEATSATLVVAKEIMTSLYARRAGRPAERSDAVPIQNALKSVAALVRKRTSDGINPDPTGSQEERKLKKAKTQAEQKAKPPQSGKPQGTRRRLQAKDPAAAFSSDVGNVTMKKK